MPLVSDRTEFQTTWYGSEQNTTVALTCKLYLKNVRPTLRQFPLLLGPTVSQKHRMSWIAFTFLLL